MYANEHFVQAKEFSDPDTFFPHPLKRLNSSVVYSYPSSDCVRKARY